MAISAEQLNIILTAKDREFARAMERNQRRVERFSKQSQKNLKGTSARFDMLATAARRFLPALGAGVIIAQVKQITTQMDEIGKKADQIGITTDALQELRFVAEGAGVSQSKFTSSLERFSKRLGEAEMGTGAAKKALEEMGIEATELTSIPIDDALKVVADEMAQIESPTERAAKAAALFGREGVAMVNMLRGGSKALTEMQAAANSAGAVIDEELIRNAEEAQTRLDAASTIIRAQLSVALAELAPMLVGAAEGFAAIVKNTVAAIQAVDRFLDPQSALEVATSNLVLALGDEIMQSQQLEIALGRSTAMSVDAATKKLEEAKSRHDNVKAIIAEQRALALGSDEYASLTARISNASDALRGLGERTVRNADMYDALEQSLVSLRNEQSAMLEAENATAEQLSRTEENIIALEEALANASGGMVSFGESLVEPVELTDRLSGGAGRAATDISGLMEAIATVPSAFEALGASAEDFDGIMQTVEGSMESAFMSMIDGTSSAKDAFKSMAASIIKELYRVLVVQRIVSAITGAFGGSSLAPTTSVAPTMRPTLAASGRPVQQGQPYVTGEHGRELFVPSQSGRILSVAQSKQAFSGGGGGGVTVNQTINVSTGVQQTVRTEIKQLMPQIAESAKSAVADAKLRGGSYGRSFA